MFRVLKIFLPVFIVTFLFYHKVLGVFFSQDDFFHIIVSQTNGTIGGFLSLFGFYPFEERGIAFYRPVFREAFFNIFYSLFGLNHMPFRLFQFGLHFINISLVYVFVQRQFTDRRISLFAAMFFGIASANVATLYYLTGGVQALGATTFILLTLLLFEKCPRWSFVTFIIALASHELAVVTPLLLAVTNWRRALPFFVPVLIYLYLEFTIIGFSKEETQYQAVFSLPKLVNTYSWYLGWAFGLPEMLIDFVRPGLKLNPSLMLHWGNYFKIIFPTFFVVFSGFLFMISYLFLKDRKTIFNKKLLMLLVWFVAGLAPVAILPWHKSTYYLYPVLPAFSAIIAYVLFKFLHRTKGFTPRMLAGVFVVSLFTLNAASVILGDSTYWAASRGRLAEKLIKDITSEYPSLPKGASLYIKNDPNYPFVAKDWGGTSKQASIILNRDDALRLYYNDSTLKVYYEDLGGLPEIKSDLIYKTVAKIN